MIFPRRASRPLIQGTIKYLCHHSQAFLSTVARYTVLFLSPMESCLMILCHATVLLLSCNALVVTLSLPLLFASVLRRAVITHHSVLLVCTWHILLDLLCHQSGTYLLVTLICQSLLAQWMWVCLCLCRHLRLLPYLDPYLAADLK